MHAISHRSCARRWAVGLSRALLVTLSVLLAACSSVQFNPSDPTRQYPPYEGEVRVLQQLPSPGLYQQVGVVLVSGVNFTSKSSMMNALKKEAANRGANAIVLQSDVKTLSEGTGSKQKRLAAWAILVPR